MALKTVGDSRAAFQAAYGRPCAFQFQGFVGEMLGSTTLAMVSPTWSYSRVFALGFETLCSTFIGDQLSEKDAEHLVTCMYKGLDLDAAQMRADAQAMRDLAAASSEEEMLASDDFKKIAELEGSFKYSYPFSAGMLALMPLVDTKPSDETLEHWYGSLKLDHLRPIKDWKYFESSAEKMMQVKQMMVEQQAAAKRKEAEKLKADAAKAAEEAAAAEVAASAE